MSLETKFPEISVVANGSSGISMRAKLTKKYNLVEYTLRDDVPQDVFISPWMQFEPVEMADERLKLAYEIARRAMTYETLMAEVDSLQKQKESLQTIIDKKQKTIWTAFEMWRADRDKMGLPVDFRDIKEWPPEMMSNY